jgi:hypothetical protein
MAATADFTVRSRERNLPVWVDCDGSEPCPLCRRSDGCRVSKTQIACLWVHSHFGTQRQANDGTRYSLYSLDTFRHIPPIDQATGLLREYFFSRTDVVAFAPPWGKTACPAYGDDALPFLVRAHLGGDKVSVPWKTQTKEGHTRPGRYRIGSYGPAPDGTTRWLVIDFDGGGDHSEPLADPTAVALTVYRLFWRKGIPCYLESSRSCAGWHLWVFFRVPIQAAKARQLAFTLLPNDALLIDGTFADPKIGAGIEVFPKRDDLNGCVVGHQMWLPWFCDAAKGGNVFYHPGDGFLDAYVPEDFETVAEETVGRILAKEKAA